MNHRIIGIFIIFGLFLTGAFYIFLEAQEENDEFQELTIKAASPSAKLFAELKEELYADYIKNKLTRNFEINIEEVPEDEAIQSFVYDKCKTIAICKNMKKKEILEYYDKNNRAPIILPIYKIPVVVVVHKSNPVDKISLSNLAKIFSGEITSWKDLNPNSVDDEIKLFVPGKDTPAYKNFDANVLKNTAMEANVETFDESELVEQVKINTGGIAFLPRCFLDDSLPTKELILKDDNDNHLPTTDSAIRDETYPMVLTIYAYVPEVKPALFEKLLTFAEKDRSGSKTIIDLKFVPIK